MNAIQIEIAVIVLALLRVAVPLFALLLLGSLIGRLDQGAGSSG